MPKVLFLPDRICKEMADTALTASSQIVTSPVTWLQRTGNVYPYNDLDSSGALILPAIVNLDVAASFFYTSIIRFNSHCR